MDVQWIGIVCLAALVACKKDEPAPCADLALDACGERTDCRLAMASSPEIEALSGYSCWSTVSAPVACQPAFAAERCPTDRTLAASPTVGSCLLFDDVCIPDDWSACETDNRSFCATCATEDPGAYLAPATTLAGQTGLGASVATGDLDGDGALDIAASGDHGVVVYFGPSFDAKGALTLHHADARVENRPALAVSDLDDDGVDDLVIGMEDAALPGTVPRYGVVAIHAGPLAPGQGDLLASAAVLVSGQTVGDGLGAALTLADLDNDGDLDVLAYAPSSDAVAIDGGALYVIDGPLLDETSPPELGAAIGGRNRFGVPFTLTELDDDPTPELLVGIAGGLVLRVDAPFVGVIDTGSADVVARAPDSQSSGAVSSLAAGDLDGDAITDLVMGQASQGVAGQVAYRAGALVASPAIDGARWLAGRCEGDAIGGALALLDVNDDGRSELLVGAAARGGRAVGGAVWTGGLKQDAQIASSWLRLGLAGWSTAPELADLTGDGQADLIVGSATFGVVEVFDGAALRAALP